MSVWGDIRKRAEGKDVREEDRLETVIKELKKKIDITVQKNIEGYVDAKLKRKYTLEEIHHLLEKESINIDHIIEGMEGKDQDKFYALSEEYDLDDYVEETFWRYVDEILK